MTKLLLYCTVCKIMYMYMYLSQDTINGLYCYITNGKYLYFIDTYTQWQAWIQLFDITIIN